MSSLRGMFALDMWGQPALSAALVVVAVVLVFSVMGWMLRDAAVHGQQASSTIRARIREVMTRAATMPIASRDDGIRATAMVDTAVILAGGRYETLWQATAVDVKETLRQIEADMNSLSPKQVPPTAAQ